MIEIMTKLLTEESMMHIVNAYFLLQRVIESSDIYPLDEVAYGRVYNAFEHIHAITPDNVEELKFSGSPSAAWLSICDGLAQEKGVHKTRISILKNLETVQNEVIPDLLESEVAEFKGNTANSNNPIKYLTECIMGWVTAAVRNPDMVY